MADWILPPGHSLESLGLEEARPGPISAVKLQYQYFYFKTTVTEGKEKKSLSSKKVQ